MTLAEQAQEARNHAKAILVTLRNVQANGGTEEQLETILAGQVELFANRVLSQLRDENETLRVVFNRFGRPCIHCGIADMAKCPHGFPGCAWADDLMAFDQCANRTVRKLRADLVMERDRRETLAKLYELEKKQNQ